MGFLHVVVGGVDDIRAVGIADGDEIGLVLGDIAHEVPPEAILSSICDCNSSSISRFNRVEKMEPDEPRFFRTVAPIYFRPGFNDRSGVQSRPQNTLRESHRHSLGRAIRWMP